MKLCKASLAVASALVLSACSDDGETGYIDSPAVTRTVEVGVNVAQVELDPLMSISDTDTAPDYLEQVDSKGFTHRIRKDGYTICYTDEASLAENCITDFALTDTRTLDITGEAHIWISHPLADNREEPTYHMYTATGEMTVDNSVLAVELPVENTQWQYITVENSNDVERVEFNTHDATDYTSVEQGESGQVGYDYYFAYVLIDSQIDVYTTKLDSATTQYSAYEANQHLPYRINLTESGGIVITDPDFDSQEPIIIYPTEPAFIASLANSGGLDLSSQFIDSNGLVSYKIKDKTSIVPEAYTYTPIMPLVDGSWHKLSQYEIALEVNVTNQIAIPALSIYVTDKESENVTIYNTTLLKFHGNYNEDGVMMVAPFYYENGAWQGTGHELPITDYGKYFVPSVFGENATTGNFYVRYNDENDNAGQTVTFIQHTFQFKDAL